MRRVRVSVLWIVLWSLASVASAQDRVVVRGGTLLDVRDGSLRADAVIVVEGDRVVSVTTGGSAPAGGTILDATGKFILPGFVDVHVHYPGWAAELFLNHGITTVVDLGNSYEWIKAQREGIERGAIPGPRLFHGGKILDAPRQLSVDPNGISQKTYQPVASAEEARRAMRKYVGNVQVMKVYGDRLAPAALRAAVEEADKVNIPVIGHFTDVRDAIEAGAHGVEHTASVAGAIVDPEALAEAQPKLRQGFRYRPEAVIDETKVPEIVRSMVEAGLYLNPTLRQTWRGDRTHRELGFPYQDFDLLINNWRLRYVPADYPALVLRGYQQIGPWNWADLSQYEQDFHHRSFQNSSLIAKVFVDAGGKLYAGTDAGANVTPGLAMHQELQLIVRAGIGELQALQAATLNPAELMRMAGRLGTVEEGSVGDLLILEENPLQDIRNTRKIWKVMSRGQILSGEYDPDFRNPIPRDLLVDYFPSPAIQDVSPEALLEGAGEVTLTLRGTGFTPYSTVHFGGVELETEWIGPSRMTAELVAELLRPGTFAVRAENPGFGGRPTLVSNEFLVPVIPTALAPTEFPSPKV